MNARAPGIALWEGVVEPVYRALKRDYVWFMQLPCVECAYLGLRRWWLVKEQYDNALYRDYCWELATGISEILLENDIRDFKLIGLGLSPSCGCRESQSSPSWGGRPREVDTSMNVRPGTGVWIRVLEEVFKEYGFNFTAYDLPPSMTYPGERWSESYPRDVEGCLRELSENLDYNYESFPVEDYIKRVHINEDMRSGRVLVAPLEAALSYNPILEKYVEEGFGLILTPKSNILTYERRDLLMALARQVENHLDYGHKVVLFKGVRASRLFEEFMKILEYRGLSRQITTTAEP